MYSAAYGTVHYEETKSFEIRVGQKPGFGLLSVAMLPQCTESDVFTCVIVSEYLVNRFTMNE